MWVCKPLEGEERGGPVTKRHGMAPPGYATSRRRAAAIRVACGSVGVDKHVGSSGRRESGVPIARSRGMTRPGHVTSRRGDGKNGCL